MLLAPLHKDLQKHSPGSAMRTTRDITRKTIASFILQIAKHCLKSISLILVALHEVINAGKCFYLSAVLLHTIVARNGKTGWALKLAWGTFIKYLSVCGLVWSQFIIISISFIILLLLACVNISVFGLSNCEWQVITKFNFHFWGGRTFCKHPKVNVSVQNIFIP